MNRGPRSIDNDLVNVGLAVVSAACATTLLLRVAGTVAARLTQSAQPVGEPASGLRVLANPDDPARALAAPGLSAVAYWLVLALLLTILSLSAISCWRIATHIRHHHERDPRRIPGTATRRDIDTAASRRALLARGRTLRPSLTSPQANEIGYLLGHSRGREIWASVEDSILVIGPPRSGKGLHLVINTILDAPGPVVTTSTRPDNLTATIDARRQTGPVAVFDPQCLVGSHPSGLRWSPIRGCERPITAMIRAAGLAATTGLSSGGVESGGFWEGRTRAALQALLHAAALEKLSTRTLFEWSLSPAAAADAVGILSSHPRAATGWRESLDAMINADPRTRDSIWMAVSQALASLADPRVLDALSPRPGEEFDPTTFLADNGTLYLLATGAGAGASWPLVAALIEDLTETARHLAAASAGARLDPPLLLALDEIGNLAPLPSLPVLMAEGGGTGITTMPVLQSLSQARNRWGDHAANTIWDASIVKVILGGASASKDLQELSVLIGERDEQTDTIAIGDHGTRSLQRPTRRAPIMPPERIRTFPFGKALVLLRSSPPLVVDLRTWQSRRASRG
ncbi:type IV secretory system conjugative DNA transfer family protein [Nocardioides carbamazepini]|uniref:type IV secretory system conjugative DNA transfer family protein n=1 Tax=Nocardioides carbamazepini TaxID=2854259 RepID=UPI002149EF11|nr:TraM recognition domain-containing protein [Nocardioides carbamazepini]MCR1785938.1 type IV secretory system conjugative DNA transfer family protein [Nocardioides carbamazepini]